MSQLKAPSQGKLKPNVYRYHCHFINILSWLGLQGAVRNYMSRARAVWLPAAHWAGLLPVHVIGRVLSYQGAYATTTTVTKTSFENETSGFCNFNLFNLKNAGELSRVWITANGVKVKKKKGKFAGMRSRSGENRKFSHFTLLFCRWQQRNVPKCKMHVQSIVLVH